MVSWHIRRETRRCRSRTLRGGGHKDALRRDYDRARQNLRELRDSTARARAEEALIRTALRSTWENQNAAWDAAKKEAEAANRPEVALQTWYLQQLNAEEPLRAKLVAAEERLRMALDAGDRAFAETIALRNTVLREHGMKVTRV